MANKLQPFNLQLLKSMRCFSCINIKILCSVRMRNRTIVSILFVYVGVELQQACKEKKNINNEATTLEKQFNGLLTYFLDLIVSTDGDYSMMLSSISQPQFISIQQSLPSNDSTVQDTWCSVSSIILDKCSHNIKNVGVTVRGKWVLFCYFYFCFISDYDSMTEDYSVDKVARSTHCIVWQLLVYQHPVLNCSCTRLSRDL